MKITEIKHPEYGRNIEEWQKWRLVYRGGREFKDAYLEQFSKRETHEEFDQRRKISYSPSFAKAAVNDIKNSIYQRMADITRTDASKTYNLAVIGQKGGVDGHGSSMNTFIGQKILPELLTMGRVGVYVDMPEYTGDTLADTSGIHPYLYYYCVENIRSWHFSPNSTDELISVLLEDTIFTYDDATGLPIGTSCRYRRVWKDVDAVYVNFYNSEGELLPTLHPNAINNYTIRLNLKRLPFIMLGITDSLLKDVADYQIALLNLASSDMAYAVKSNFPFYTEQYDSRVASGFNSAAGIYAPEDNDSPLTIDGVVATPQTAATVDRENNIKVGTASGRRYSQGLERPGFIHPSSEPLTASMAKQNQIKAELRQLINLALTNTEPKFASAESKSMDQRSLESGLSYIGLELENAERKIALVWSQYENNKPATINYPQKYNLKSDADKLAEITNLLEILAISPSPLMKKEILKKIVELVLSTDIPYELEERIDAEIDALNWMSSDYQSIASDVLNGLVSVDLASQARGYPKGEADKAKQDHTDRLARIAAAQAEATPKDARGVKDTQTDPNLAKNDKKTDSTTKTDPSPGVRGAGK